MVPEDTIVLDVAGRQVAKAIREAARNADAAIGRWDISSTDDSDYEGSRESDEDQDSGDDFLQIRF
jgi:hypothetical protein